MIFPDQAVRIVIATKPVDFRKGHDGLAAMAHSELGFALKAGVMVVFRSKRGDRIKVLFWDGCRVALNWALPQFVWRNYPETGKFRRDSRDFKEALVTRGRSFGSKGVVNLTRWPRRNGLFRSVRCSRRPSKRRRLRFDDSVLRLRNGGWRELRNGFGRQCGRLQTGATRPESEILACNALVFETVDGCFPPCCSSPCGNDVRDRMRLHVWPLRRIAACL